MFCQNINSKTGNQLSCNLKSLKMKVSFTVLYSGQCVRMREGCLCTPYSQAAEAGRQPSYLKFIGHAGVNKECNRVFECTVAQVRAADLTLGGCKCPVQLCNIHLQPFFSSMGFPIHSFKILYNSIYFII